MNKGDYVFVYGTLRPGQYNFIRLGLDKNDQVEVIGPAVLSGACMYSIHDMYPAVVEGEDAVVGELLRILNPKAGENMDRLEGHPNFYKRKLVNVSDGAQAIPAWVYYYQHPVDREELIPSGDWLSRTG